MKCISNFRMLSLLFLAAGAVAELGAGSLELGHIRARSRGWIAEDRPEVVESAKMTSSTPTVEEPVAYDREDSAVAGDMTIEGPEEDESFSEAVAYEEQVESHVNPEIERAMSEAPAVNAAPRQASKEVAKDARSRNRLILIGGLKQKAPDPRKGYLAMGAPKPLRFSDSHLANARPPAPALPEFSFSSTGYPAYLIESPLPEDAENDLAALSEIVVELEPHEVVSGKINTRIATQDDLVEHFEMDEKGSTVLRPEEVLIFFETDTQNGSAGALVPFSPATPNLNPQPKSSATLKKE